MMKTNRGVAMTTRTTSHEPARDTPPETDELLVENDQPTLPPTRLPTTRLPLEADPADVLDQLRSADDIDLVDDIDDVDA
jgi:hypothetical protein